MNDFGWGLINSVVSILQTMILQRHCQDIKNSFKDRITSIKMWVDGPEE